MLKRKCLEIPILGFKIIEYLVNKYLNLEVLNLILNSVFHDLNKAKTEAFVNLIHSNSNEFVVIGEVKSSEDLAILLSSMIYIKYKFRTEAMGTETLPVIFQRELNLCCGFSNY